MLDEYQRKTKSEKSGATESEPKTRNDVLERKRLKQFPLLKKFRDDLKNNDLTRFKDLSTKYIKQMYYSSPNLSLKRKPVFSNRRLEHFLDVPEIFGANC